MADWVTWQQPDRDEDDMRAYLVQALARTGLCVTLQDDRQNYLFVANLFDPWELPTDGTPTDESLFGRKIAEQLSGLKTSALESGETVHQEILAEQDSVFEFIVETIKGSGDGKLLLTRIINLTDQKVAERVTKTLLREVSHRSKNLLAIVQSIASQTARHTRSKDDFLKEFRGRLHSLSKAQDLVTESSWRGARLHDLIARQAEKYVGDGTTPIRIKGDDVNLAPNAVMHIGLALHELIIKAVANGVMEDQTRPITVDCTRTKMNGQETIRIDWLEETGQPEPVDGPSNGSFEEFSKILLERVVPASINGKARLSHEKTANRYEIVFPASNENISSE